MVLIEIVRVHLLPTHPGESFFEDFICSFVLLHTAGKLDISLFGGQIIFSCFDCGIHLELCRNSL